MKTTLHMKEMKRKEWILLIYWYERLKIDGNQTKRMNSLKKMKKTLHLKELKRKEWILLIYWYERLKIERNQTKRMNSLNKML